MIQFAFDFSYPTYTPTVQTFFRMIINGDIVLSELNTPTVQTFFFDAVSKNVYVENKNKWN